MSLIKATEGSKTIKVQWESISGSAIVWEVKNENLPLIHCVMDAQMTGKKIGDWNDISTGDINVVRTESTTFNGNAGGVVWHLKTDESCGIYMGLAWGDPLIGEPHFNLSSGWGNSSGRSYVHESIKDWWEFPSTDWPLKITEEPNREWVQNGVHINVCPNSNPFRITFQKATPEQIAEFDVGVTPFFHNSKL